MRRGIATFAFLGRLAPALLGSAAILTFFALPRSTRVPSCLPLDPARYTEDGDHSLAVPLPVPRFHIGERNGHAVHLADILPGSVLEASNPRGADWRGVVLPGVMLAGCGLQGANLAGDNLRQSDLRRTNVAGAGADPVLGMARRGLSPAGRHVERSEAGDHG